MKNIDISWTEVTTFREQKSQQQQSQSTCPIRIVFPTIHNPFCGSGGRKAQIFAFRSKWKYTLEREYNMKMAIAKPYTKLLHISSKEDYTDNITFLSLL